MPRAAVSRTANVESFLVHIIQECTEKSILNLIESSQIWIVITHFRLIWKYKRIPFGFKSVGEKQLQYNLCFSQQDSEKISLCKI